VPAPDDENPASFNRRRLLVLGGFALTTAAVAATLDSSSDGTSSAGGATANPKVKLKSEPTPESPAQPGSIGGASAPPPDHVFDRVLRNGRVMDPETGYDRLADVGIDGETVTAISEAPLTGRATVDATGLVVAPGFIDVLSYEPNDLGSWFKIADGVTSNLCMHGINDTAGNFFVRYGTAEPVPPVHYGGAFDNPYERSVVLRLPQATAQGAQLDRLVAAFDEGVRNGWMGLDVEPEYTPWVQTPEFMALAEVAAKHQVPMFWHMRYSDPDEPGTSMEAIDEMLTVARETGVAVHVAHITSMATHVMNEAIAKIDDARASGIDITACMYPYDFWATTLGSERFAPGWQDRFRISYGDLEVPGTGERLTEATFTRFQRQNTLVAAHAIPEDDVRAALRTDWVMMGSDAIIEPNARGRPNNHPRAAGTFSRTLGRYARDEQTLPLMAALAKMTILPARRLGGRVPALQRKGRLQLGADADLTLFDPATVADRATIADPAQESAGITWVFVRGQAVKTPDGIDRNIRPGLGLKAEV
jgi:N-acyl-D-aspartate/D-glutamate deacylase